MGMAVEQGDDSWTFTCQAYLRFLFFIRFQLAVGICTCTGTGTHLFNCEFCFQKICYHWNKYIIDLVTKEQKNKKKHKKESQDCAYLEALGVQVIF